MYCGGVAGDDPRDAEVGELADAVLDVEPQPAERLHQRLDVERFVGPRVQVAEDARRAAATARACETVHRGPAARRS